MPDAYSLVSSLLDGIIAQIGPARAAWFKDPDGDVFGVREGPVPSVK